jgi:CheY-like chemotaxis protein
MNLPLRSHGSPTTLDCPSLISALAGKNTSRRASAKNRAAERKQSRAAHAGNRVLLFSGIWEVALYRAEVLRRHGIPVLTPRTKEEAVQAIKRGGFDIAVLTYTLPNDTVHELVDMIRERYPECRLIAISQSGRIDRRIAPDATVIADEGPAALIEAVRRLSRPVN